MVDACVAAGSAGCKLMDFVGDKGDRNDVAALLNGAHDVIDFLPRLVNLTELITILAGPQTLSHGGRASRCPRLHEGYDSSSYPLEFVAHFAAEYLFNLLYTPTAWAEHCNNEVYQLIGLIHQTALSHNVTLDGGVKINVPSGNFSFDKSRLGKSGAALAALTSYSSAAIAGADNFNDDSATISDVFDTIVENTRDITPTCKFSFVRSYPFALLIRPKSSWNRLDHWVRASNHFLRMRSDDRLSYTSYGWPIRSVEKLTPYVPKKLTHPVLLVGNTVRAFHS